MQCDAQTIAHTCMMLLLLCARRFIMAEYIGGLTDHMSNNHKNRIDTERSRASQLGPSNTGELVKVDCWPLHEMMQALGKTRIDYWRCARDCCSCAATFAVAHCKWAASQHCCSATDIVVVDAVARSQPRHRGQ